MSSSFDLSDVQSIEDVSIETAEKVTNDIGRC